MNHKKLMKTMKIEENKRRSVYTYGDIKVKKIRAIIYMNMNFF